MARCLASCAAFLVALSMYSPIASAQTNSCGGAPPGACGCIHDYSIFHCITTPGIDRVECAHDADVGLVACVTGENNISVDDIPIYSAGKPRIYTYRFNSTSATAAVLSLLNGATGNTEKISSAQVRLNGTVVVDWEEINGQTNWLERNVTLHAGSNRLEIENDSATIGFLTVSIGAESIVPN